MCSQLIDVAPAEIDEHGEVAVKRRRSITQLANAHRGRCEERARRKVEDETVLLLNVTVGDR